VELASERALKAVNEAEQVNLAATAARVSDLDSDLVSRSSGGGSRWWWWWWEEVE